MDHPTFETALLGIRVVDPPGTGAYLVALLYVVVVFVVAQGLTGCDARQVAGRHPPRRRRRGAARHPPAFLALAGARWRHRPRRAAEGLVGRPVAAAAAGRRRRRGAVGRDGRAAHGCRGPPGDRWPGPRWWTTARRRGHAVGPRTWLAAAQGAAPRRGPPPDEEAAAEESPRRHRPPIVGRGRRRPASTRLPASSRLRRGGAAAASGRAPTEQPRPRRRPPAPRPPPARAALRTPGCPCPRRRREGPVARGRGPTAPAARGRPGRRRTGVGRRGAGDGMATAPPVSRPEDPGRWGPAEAEPASEGGSGPGREADHGAPRRAAPGPGTSPRSPNRTSWSARPRPNVHRCASRTRLGLAGGAQPRARPPCRRGRGSEPSAMPRTDGEAPAARRAPPMSRRPRPPPSRAVKRRPNRRPSAEAEAEAEPEPSRRPTSGRSPGHRRPTEPKPEAGEPGGSHPGRRRARPGPPRQGPRRRHRPRLASGQPFWDEARRPTSTGTGRGQEWLEFDYDNQRWGPICRA